MGKESAFSKPGFAPTKRQKSGIAYIGRRGSGHKPAMESARARLACIVESRLRDGVVLRIELEGHEVTFGSSDAVWLECETTLANIH